MDAREVWIGRNDNNQTSILLGVNGQAVATEWSHQLLSCSEARWLWLSWNDGYIQLGSGSVVGAHVIVFWQDPDRLPVHAIALASAVEAKWEVANVPSKNCDVILSLTS